MTISSCISKCRIDTLQGKKVTDSALEKFQSCVETCRYSQGDSLLGDFRRLVQSTTALFGYWAQSAIVCAPVVEPYIICQTNFQNMAHTLALYMTQDSHFANFDNVRQMIIERYARGMTMIVKPLPPTNVGDGSSKFYSSRAGGRGGTL